MFSNLKISTRLVGAFTLLVAMLLVIGALSVTRTMSVEADLVDITERRMTVIAEMELLRDEGNFQARAIRNIALFTDPAKVAQEKQAIAESRTKVNEITTKVDALITSAKGRELQTKLQESRKPFRDAVDKFIYESQAKLDEKWDHGIKGFHHDADVVHALQRHSSSWRR